MLVSLDLEQTVLPDKRIYQILYTASTQGQQT